LAFDVDKRDCMVEKSLEVLELDILSVVEDKEIDRRIADVDLIEETIHMLIFTSQCFCHTDRYIMC
jgi:hypothetical protein